MMMNERQAEILKRSGRDALTLDKRPLNEILDDKIPYERWDRQFSVLRRAGYSDYQDLFHRK